MNIEVSVITVNYNGLKDTCRLIDTLPASDPSVEIIVVDNGSLHDEATEIGQRYPHVKAIRSEENLGFAGGNNIGIKAAKGKYLFFINNDTEIPPELQAQPDGQKFIHPLTDRLASSERVGAVCPKIRFFWDKHPVQFAGFTPLSHITLRNASIGFGEEDYGQYDTAHPTPYVHGAAMLVKRSAIERAGLMPECYFLYYEELDWSLMLARCGYELWYEPAFTIYHKESQTTGQTSPLKTYYIARNRLLFARRNVSYPTRLLTYAYLMLPVTLRDVFKNALAGRFDLCRATLRGITHFLLGREGRASL